MVNTVIRRLQILEKASGVAADHVVITLSDGSTRRVLWTEALLAVLSNEVIEIDGTGDLYGLCQIMLNQ